MDSQLTIVIEPASEGGFTAFIPEVPGVLAVGDTVEEAREMVLEELRELTAYRRQAAIRLQSPGSVIERFAI